MVEEPLLHFQAFVSPSQVHPDPQAAYETAFTICQLGSLPCKHLPSFLSTITRKVRAVKGDDIKIEDCMIGAYSETRRGASVR